jgi:hypothetical protein
MSHLLAILDDFICKVEPEWKAMHRVADKRLKAVADIYEKALLRLRTSIDVDKLSEESIAMMADKIDWLIFEAACDEAYDLLGLILVDAGTEAAKYLSSSLMRLKTNSVNKAKPIVMPVLEGGEQDIQLTGMFNIRNPRAAAWAATHVGENIRQVNDSTRKGVQVIITDALQHGGHPYETARLIRQHIGLTENQMKGILNYQSKLDEEGRPQAQVDRMIDAQIRRKIRARSVMIARTETQAAACAGQQLHWEDQLSKGYLNNQDFQKEWIVTPDDRLCPICAAMDGKRTDIDGVFEGGNKTPPLHVCCRCSIGIVEREGRTLQEYAGTEIGQDWTKVDRLAGIIPQLATLPGKVKDLVKPKSKVPDEEVKPVKPKKPDFKKMTPEERIAYHHAAIDKMTDKEIVQKPCRDYLSKHGYTPWYGLNDVDIADARAYVKQSVMLQETYPMKKKLVSFELKDFGEDEKGTYAWYKTGTHQIQLNLHHYQNREKLLKGYANDVKSGFHPTGTNADSILTHEYGHAVHYDMKAVAQSGMPMDMMTAMSNDQDITYLFKKKGSDIMRVLGKYATKNEREFFAEGFAQMHHVGKDTNDYTKFVYSIVKGGN